MALSTYSLVSLEELKDYLGISQDRSERDTALERILNRVTDEIETYLDRQIVTRTTVDPLTRLTEYHTIPDDTSLYDSSELWTLQWPIITVTSVHEDEASPRTYGATYLLTSGTDYEVVAAKGLIRRIDSTGTLDEWASGYRAIRVVYSAGYATTETVPARIKSPALRYAALIWSETERRQFGVSSVSDALGNFQRFAAAQLSKDMRDTLAPERRWPGTYLTGEAA